MELLEASKGLKCHSTIGLPTISLMSRKSSKRYLSRRPKKPRKAFLLRENIVLKPNKNRKICL